MTMQAVNPQELVLAVEGDFNRALAEHQNNAVKWHTEKEFAIQQLYKNDYAIKTAQRNPASVQNAVKNIAAIGLSLNPALKHAYLVPRDGAINLEVSYMGLIHLAQDTGNIVYAKAEIVYANDHYQNNGQESLPTHKYQAFGDRGAIVGVYCTVKLTSGEYLTHEMQIADVYAIRDRSSAWKSGKKGPWATDEKEMIKKTCVKQGSKYWPKVERMQTAVELINRESGEGIDFEAEQAQQNYDPKEDAADLAKAYEAQCYEDFTLVTEKLEDWQMGKLFKAPHVNSKIRDFARQANKWMVEQQRYLEGLIQCFDDEGLVEAWHEMNENQRAVMKLRLSDDHLKLAREWVKADHEAQQQAVEGELVEQEQQQ